jgi:hypothetical protein
MVNAYEWCVMKVLVWVAEHWFWVGVIGAAIAVALKFEHWLPRRLKRMILITDIFIILTTPLLGALKDQLDAKWKGELQRQVREAHAVASRVEAKQKPRIITSEQRTKFKNLLKNAPKGFVTVVATASDTETDDYAAQIRSMLDEAGYAASGDMKILHVVGAVQNFPDFQPISPGVHSERELPVYLANIQGAFKEIGINAPAAVVRGPEKIQMRPGDLIVVVAENR